MKTKLILLYGGKSAEHEVSLQTAFSVINALDLENSKLRQYTLQMKASGFKDRCFLGN